MIAALLVIFLFLPLPSFSYLPPVEMILKKTVQRNHGSGFRMQFVVTLENDPSHLRFEETWTVKNAHAMRVQVRGLSPANKSFKVDYIYKDGSRYRLNESQQLVFSKTTSEHFETLFAFKTSDGLRKYLEEANILTPQEKNDEENNKDIEGEPATNTTAEDASEKLEIEEESKTFIYQPSPDLRLSRSSGTISFALGRPQPKGSLNVYPGMWVDQDRFRLLKVRLSSGATLTASDYKKIGKRDFPGKRTISWKGQKFNIQAISIDYIRVGPKTRRFLEPRSLLKTVQKTTDALPETTTHSHTLMNDFYLRFR